MKPLYVQIKINENLYLKDPQPTKLGKKIIEHSVLLIDELGLEQFTFKKLADKIGSTEATVYRYFENKHQLFVYLLNWYWEWMIVRIDINTLNVEVPHRKLAIVLDIIVDTANRNTAIEFVDEEVLHRIVVTEGTKGYHHKLVDKDNREQFFHSYKRLCEKIAATVLEVKPTFPYPISLASTLIETANNNIYFAKHLPRLTDLRYENDEQLLEHLKTMLRFMAFSLLHSPDNTTQPRFKNTNGVRANGTSKLHYTDQ